MEISEIKQRLEYLRGLWDEVNAAIVIYESDSAHLQDELVEFIEAQPEGWIETEVGKMYAAQVDSLDQVVGYHDDAAYIESPFEEEEEAKAE